MEESESDDTVETSLFQRNDVNRESASTEPQAGSSREGSESRASESSSTVPGSSFRATRTLQQRLVSHTRLVAAIKEFLCVPFYSTCELRAWIENPTLAFFDKADNDYKRAVSTVARQVQFLSCEDIWKLVENAPYRTWYARNDEHYLSTDKSVGAIRMLLVFQYETGDATRAFLQRLYNICERVEPKRNSLFVCGPACCGKTWFFDMVCAYYLNVGHVANFVRGEHFPLNDCVGRRILMWNEPNLMLSAYDTIKMIAGGDPCPANVKYQGHSVISRTPLLLTGNRFIFPRDDVWSTRMYHERWSTCCALKYYVRYPSPTAYYYIMREYGIHQ